MGAGLRDVPGCDTIALTAAHKMACPWFTEAALVAKQGAAFVLVGYTPNSPPASKKFSEGTLHFP